MRIRLRLAVMALAAALAACGDGVHTSAVRVAGDSLSDSGTFDFKATVQGQSLADTMIWTDHVAAAVGVGALCPRYLASDADTVGFNPAPAAQSCTSYGVVRARINMPDAITGGDSSPFSIIQQLKDLAAAGVYGPQELLLLDGGGNDLADLMRAFLMRGLDDGASYRALLGELLTPAQLPAPSLDDPDALARAGALYMDALAARLAEQIGVQALDRGARRVVVLNLPAVTDTPYFLAMLAQVAERQGGGPAGTAAANQVSAMAESWITAFNQRLSASFADEARVAVVDLYGAMRHWVSPPLTGQANAYGFTNTTEPACPPLPGQLDALGLPVYFLGACKAADLSAQPPLGMGANWWRTYVFSDDFHGSPMTNRLMGEQVADTLRARDWL